ncbi:MAG: hypothetical protein QY312_03075 [Candidatus Dojkabacteria bacterium]|nr:MAG: hypothetical protein QY312_03075 [Candidatus Dojkabacteria bacterium]
MVTILSTGDRESDLFHWFHVKNKLPKEQQLLILHADTETGKAKLLQELNTVTFFSADKIIVAHSVEVTKDIFSLMLSYSQDIYVVSTVGKLPTKIPTTVSLVKEKIGDATLKSLIDKNLRDLGITSTREELARLYLPLMLEDFGGRERLSPLRCMTLLRQLQAIASEPEQKRPAFFKNILTMQEGKASQWEILANFFSSNKKKQNKYFQSLSETMSSYEIMSFTKSTILLLLVLLQAKREGYDNASMAKKLGKHPFYIDSLLRSAQANSISSERAEKLLLRLFNLETALKSGKFEDEGFGFEVLLATS